MGHELAKGDVRGESIQPSSTDMHWTSWHVSFVPKNRHALKRVPDETARIDLAAFTAALQAVD
jgi:hypothetical protein